jgi:hypothetical protein
MLMRRLNDKPLTGKYFKNSFVVTSHSSVSLMKSPSLFNRLKILFTDEFKPLHLPIIFPEHEYLLHHRLYPTLVQINLACSKIYEDPRDPERPIGS